MQMQMRFYDGLHQAGELRVDCCHRLAFFTIYEFAEPAFGMVQSDIGLIQVVHEQFLDAIHPY